MQGLYVRNSSVSPLRRPKSKKEVRELVATNQLRNVVIEATSLYGREYQGPLADAPDGTYTICGPDPYQKRSFYLNIKKAGEKVVVS